jgi:formylglycine-generating enzyme required for sulfatase activity
MRSQRTVPETAAMQPLPSVNTSARTVRPPASIRRAWTAPLALAALIVLLGGCGDFPPSTTPQTPDQDVTRVGRMIRIPAAGQRFEMGREADPLIRLRVHAVGFTYDFLIDSAEVTQADYDSLMTRTYHDYTTPPWQPAWGAGAAYPAYDVTWYDALLYCNARSRSEGRDTVYRYTAISGTAGDSCTLSDVTVDISKNGYRLPSEAEWEYACRAGTGSDYFWGASGIEDSAGQYAWNANSYFWGTEHAGQEGTQKIGGRLPNAFGLHDMIGNVKEWCGDYYGFDYYAQSPATDPFGPTTGEKRIVRGGSWKETLFTSAQRSEKQPFLRDYLTGFRTVRIAD